MANILLARIDNRLVHGQVAVIWTSHIGANLIIVANDEIANDEIQQNIMSMGVPEGVGARFFTIQKTIDVINKAADHQKIIIVVKTPQDMRKLIEGNVPIKEVNLNNLHFAEGKKLLHPNVAVSKQDIEDFNYIASKGINCIFQSVPSASGVNIQKLLKEEK